MNRRGFLTSLAGMVGGVALSQAVPTWPFRVFSFPAEIVVPSAKLLTISDITREALRVLVNNLQLSTTFNMRYSEIFPEAAKIDQKLNIRMPMRYQPALLPEVG